jgi:Helix-hairpin-helix motif
MLWSLVPLGLGAWVPLVAGLRARRPRWVALGVAWLAPVVVAYALSAVIPDDVELGLVVGGWFAAAATTAAIYPSYRRERALIEEIDRHMWDQEGVRIRRRLEIERRERERKRGRELARADPVAALERGVGRPDLAGADHCDLIDVNHAPERILRSLPGVDEDLARRIVATRENVGRFSSIADMCFVLDLDPDLSARLECRAIAIDA